MKTRSSIILIIVLVIVAAVAALIVVRVSAKGRNAVNLSPPERALLSSLPPDQQRDVLKRYSAEKAAGKAVRLASFMPETAYSVKVTVARRATLQSYLDVNGDVTTETNVSVYPDIGGRLASLRVALGDRVRKDEVIAQVDPSKPGANYALSPVRAPITGTVTEINTPSGSTVTTSTSIVKVGIVDAIEIHVDIRERDVGSVAPGLKGRAQFEAFPGESFPITIVRVSPVLDTTSRTREIVLRFDRKDARILPGMFARVRILTEAHVNKVTVPATAVLERYGEHYAYVVSSKESVDRAELRKVSKGVTIDNMVEVIEGIADGEKVVTAGQAALGDGALLRVVTTEGGAK